MKITQIVFPLCPSNLKAFKNVCLTHTHICIKGYQFHSQMDNKRSVTLIEDQVNKSDPKFRNQISTKAQVCI